MSKVAVGAAANTKVEGQNWSGGLALLTIAMAIGLVGAAKAHAADRVEPYRAAREAYITGFRVSGVHDPAPLVRLDHDLRCWSSGRLSAFPTTLLQRWRP